MIYEQSSLPFDTPSQPVRTNYSVSVISLRLVRERDLTIPGNRIDSPAAAANILMPLLVAWDRETLIAMHLDTKNRITALETIFIGSLNTRVCLSRHGCLGRHVIRPADVFKGALLHNAANIIIAHNHPSGDPTPSAEDIKTTTLLKSAGEILGIELLDHIVIGDGRYTSLKERNLAF